MPWKNLEAAGIIFDSRGNYDCEMLCSYRAQDEAAANIARRSGDYKLAEKIVLEISEREARCLGGVMCNRQVECGIEHGNVKVSEEMI